jgi:tRNA pseudouridine13 synthase
VRKAVRGLVRTEGRGASASPQEGQAAGHGWASGVRHRGQAVGMSRLHLGGVGRPALLEANVSRATHPRKRKGAGASVLLLLGGKALARVRLKQKPEDFSVKESYRFDEDPEGRYRVYLMDKQKLSTFEALDRIRARYGLSPGSISFCGLKDKQGRTEQLIAVDGAEVEVQDPDLRLKPLGRTARPLSARNTTSNRFSVTVRALNEEDLAHLPLAAAEVNRLGVVNYFDSQRFGSLKHGQGYIAKDLLRGDFESALKNYLAQPSPLDRTDDAKVKEFWRKHWGDWNRRCPFEANRRYERILRSLKERPDDFLHAFLQIDADYRALLLFTYQSWLWNEGVRRLLQLLLPRTSLFPMRYQAGTLLFHTDADPETLAFLRTATFPLLAPDTKIQDARIAEAVAWVLGKEKLTLEGLRIPGARLLYFKHEERPVLVQPQKLVLGRVAPDELNRGLSKLNVAFTLSPGSYATLVVKRLFHREGSPAEEPKGAEIPWRSGEHTPYGPRPTEGTRPARPAPPSAAPATGRGQRTPATFERAEARPARAPSVPAAATPAAAPPLGYRAQAAAKKEARKVARAADKGRRKPSKA